MTRSKSFRELLEKPGLLLRPCAYDALSAILVERAGFSVVGTTGYGIFCYSSSFRELMAKLQPMCMFELLAYLL